MTQEWVEDLFEFDLRIFRTLPTFFFKPGRLTKEYVQGRRVRYVRPLRLYLVSSFLLFSILAFSDFATIDAIESSPDDSLADSVAATTSSALSSANLPAPSRGSGEGSGGENDRAASAQGSQGSEPGEDFASEQRRQEVARDVTENISLNLSFFSNEAQRQRAEQYVKDRIARTIIDPNAFIRGMIDRAPYVMFFLLPLFAFLLKLLYIRRKKLYVQHLIFALHIHAFIFFTFAIATGCLLSELPALNTIGSWLTLAPFIYVYVAMQHVYQQGWIKTGIKLFVLFTMYNTVLTFGVFFLAIASLLLM